MSLQIVWTAQFKKDYKIALKRGLDITLLDDCIRLLAAGQQLPARLRDLTASQVNEGVTGNATFNLTGFWFTGSNLMTWYWF